MLCFVVQLQWQSDGKGGVAIGSVFVFDLAGVGFDEASQAR
jgi:hypothetical protein